MTTTRAEAELAEEQPCFIDGDENEWATLPNPPGRIVVGFDGGYVRNWDERFAKRQQMQWTKRGAHLLLQTRTRALDGTLRPHFERWYPGLANDNSIEAQRAAA